MAETQPRAVAYPGLFKATYYVDPTFTGLQAGSESNPFTTCAAAFTAALALSLTSALILLPPGINLTENVVFPTTGNDWEIACLHGAVGTVSAGITGTVTANPAGTTRYRLTEIFVTGLISGANTGTSQLILTRVRNTSGMTLTGAGAWSVSLTGRGLANLNAFNGSSGAISIATGLIFAQNWVFLSTISLNGTPNFFDYCRFNNGTITGTAGSPLTFTECTFVVLTTITDSTVEMDGKSLASAMGTGLVLAGAASLKTANSNLSATIASVTGNGASTAFAGRNPAGLYECVFDTTLLVAGTAGAMQVNVIYTDLTGTLTTAPVGPPLNIASAVGTKSAGSLPFQHNGAAAAIAWSVTGIVTPGAMSVGLAVAIRRTN